MEEERPKGKECPRVHSTLLTLDINPHADFYWESGKRTIETTRNEPIIVESKRVEISFFVSLSLSHTHKLQEWPTKYSIIRPFDPSQHQNRNMTLLYRITSATNTGTQISFSCWIRYVCMVAISRIGHFNPSSSFHWATPVSCHLQMKSDKSNDSDCT